jgi:xanthine dehydrogenase accessory factor
MADPTSPSPPGLYEQLVALEREGLAFVLVTLVEALGSTPQDAGAKMLVTGAGRHTGTVGGGRIEAQAISFAQAMLAGNGTDDMRPRFVNWSLKGDVGMTCGGSVKLYFEPHPAADGGWRIVIFGAGHVTQALVPVLVPLPCSLTICDSRREWLEQLPRARNLRTVAHDNPAELVPTLPDQSFVLCMTKGHSTDRPILERALKEREFPFLGVIGSDAKAAVLRRELIANGVSPARAAGFHCPVGLEFGTNHPHEIALSIAAQLLTERDRGTRT